MATPWFLPGRGQVYYRDRETGQIKKGHKTPAAGDVLLMSWWQSVQEIDKKYWDCQSVDIWVEPELIWQKVTAERIPRVGYPVLLDRTVPWHELGAPFDPVKIIEQQKGQLAKFPGDAALLPVPPSFMKPPPGDDDEDDDEGL